MAKSKSKKNVTEENLLSSVLPLLEMRYEEPLFQLACHPEEPILFSGLASGHVFCHKYDSEKLQDRLAKNISLTKKESSSDDQKKWTVCDVSTKQENVCDTPGIELLWKTKRHKGSVRCIALDSDGKHIFTIGTDNIIKKADAKTGKVLKKANMPAELEGKYTKMVTSATHPQLILGDEQGSVFLLDSDTLHLKNKLTNVHNDNDAINDIFHFAKKSAHRYISLGQTTLAHWDCRVSNEDDSKIDDDDETAKRKVFLSDDQEDEILCGTFVDPEEDTVIVCGMGDGVLTVWNPKKNGLHDQLTRVKISKEDSIDCIVPTLQDDGCIWAGCSNGRLYKVHAKAGKILEVRIHDKADEVAFLDLDHDYKLVSGGMDHAKLWSSQTIGDNSDEPSEIDSDDDVSDSNSDDDMNTSGSDSDELQNEEVSKNRDSGTKAVLSDDESDSGEDSDSDEFIEGQLIGLSKEELLAELDKDINGSSESDSESNKKPTIKRKVKQSKQRSLKKVKPSNSEYHGIRKFEGL